MHWNEFEITAFSLDETCPNREDKYISRTDYQRLITTALYLENYRLAMLIQSLCHMDLRFSELSQITVEAVRSGIVELLRRRKILQMEIPGYLQESLEIYARRGKIHSGVVFQTSKGKMMDRSNVWKDIKKFCQAAGLNAERITLLKLKFPMIHDYYPFYPMPDGPPFSQKCR